MRDVASGRTSSYDVWIAECADSEKRSREECVEQLMNALARGDVAIVDRGDA